MRKFFSKRAIDNLIQTLGGPMCTKIFLEKEKGGYPKIKRHYKRGSNIMNNDACFVSSFIR